MSWVKLAFATLVVASLAPTAQPQGLVRADSPSLGRDGAPVTVVLFCDFECPFCANVRPTVAATMAAYPEDVRFVFRHFPLEHRHPNARRASEAAACAHEQGRFWEMYESLLTHQAELHEEGLKQQARQVGLDARIFDRCFDRAMTRGVWRRDVADGAARGVTATPTFFVNGRMVEGSLSFEDLDRMIRTVLGR